MIPWRVSLVFAPSGNHLRGEQALFLRKEGGKGSKEASEEDQNGSGQVATLTGNQEGKLRGVGRHRSRFTGWEPGKGTNEGKDRRIVTPAARKRRGQMKI